MRARRPARPRRRARSEAARPIRTKSDQPSERESRPLQREKRMAVALRERHEGAPATGTRATATIGGRRLEAASRQSRVGRRLRQKLQRRAPRKLRKRKHLRASRSRQIRRDGNRAGHGSRTLHPKHQSTQQRRLQKPRQQTILQGRARDSGTDGATKASKNQRLSEKRAQPRRNRETMKRATHSDGSEPTSPRSDN